MEKRAFRIAQIASGDREEALDIVQDAMLTLVNKYASRPENEWGPLFHRILQSRIMDWHRRTRVRSRWRVWLNLSDETQEDPLDNLKTEHSVLPERQDGNERMVSDLEHALEQLPTRQQQAFLLRVWEGMDVAETARAMGCSLGSVKTHYSRAVHRAAGPARGTLR